MKGVVDYGIILGFLLFLMISLVVVSATSIVKVYPENIIIYGDIGKVYSFKIIVESDVPILVRVTNAEMYYDENDLLRTGQFVLVNKSVNIMVDFVSEKNIETFDVIDNTGNKLKTITIEIKDGDFFDKLLGSFVAPICFGDYSFSITNNGVFIPAGNSLLDLSESNVSVNPS